MYIAKVKLYPAYDQAVQDFIKAVTPFTRSKIEVNKFELWTTCYRVPYISFEFKKSFEEAWKTRVYFYEPCRDSTFYLRHLVVDQSRVYMPANGKDDPYYDEIMAFLGWLEEHFRRKV